MQTNKLESISVNICCNIFWNKLNISWVSSLLFTFSLLVSASAYSASCNGQAPNESLRKIGANTAAYAGLSDAVYGESSIPDGYTQLDQKNDPDTGFHARTYKSKNGEIVIAYRGTNEGKDWKANFSRSEVSLQALSALQYARKVKSKYAKTGQKVKLTGHSLGGNLAQFSASILDLDAVTFNTADLNHSELQMAGKWDKSFNSNQIVNIVNREDPLNAVNQITKLGSGDTLGSTTYVDYDTSVESSFFYPTGKYNPLSYSPLIKGNKIFHEHKMGHMRSFLECLQEQDKLYQKAKNKHSSKATKGKTIHNKVINPF